jgi:farnesyl diphosphate synthase
MENYSAIVNHKTSYYSFVLPVRLAMIMAEISWKSEMYKQVEEILLEIGHLFQIQDDFLDCFGEPEKTGKIGTDIQESKCTWLFVESIRLCNRSRQEKSLKDNYLAAKYDPNAVAEVKRIYEGLGMREHYEENLSQNLSSIRTKIKNLEDAPHFPPGLTIMLQNMVTQTFPSNA